MTTGLLTLPSLVLATSGLVQICHVHVLYII